MFKVLTGLQQWDLGICSLLEDSVFSVRAGTAHSCNLIYATYISAIVYDSKRPCPTPGNKLETIVTEYCLKGWSLVTCTSELLY